jgi:hypothetical protein
MLALDAEMRRRGPILGAATDPGSTDLGSSKGEPGMYPMFSAPPSGTLLSAPFNTAAPFCNICSTPTESLFSTVITPPPLLLCRKALNIFFLVF